MWTVYTVYKWFPVHNLISLVVINIIWVRPLMVLPVVVILPILIPYRVGGFFPFFKSLVYIQMFFRSFGLQWRRNNTNQMCRLVVFLWLCYPLYHHLWSEWQERKSIIQWSGYSCLINLRIRLRYFIIRERVQTNKSTCLNSFLSFFGWPRTISSTTTGSSQYPRGICSISCSSYLCDWCTCSRCWSGWTTSSSPSPLHVCVVVSVDLRVSGKYRRAGKSLVRKSVPVAPVHGSQITVKNLPTIGISYYVLKWTLIMYLQNPQRISIPQCKGCSYNFRYFDISTFLWVPEIKK